MADNAQQMGGRLALLDPERINDARATLFRRFMSTMVPWADDAHFQTRTPDGRLIGPFNVLLYSPVIGGTFLDMQMTEGKHTTLNERVRQVVILTVGSVWKASYELYAHAAVSRKAGLSEPSIVALVRGEPSDDLSLEERLAQRFTLQLTATHRVEDDVYAEARAAFGETGLVDIILLAGCYHTVCSLLNAFEVPAPTSTSR